MLIRIAVKVDNTQTVFMLYGLTGTRKTSVCLSGMACTLAGFYLTVFMGVSVTPLQIKLCYLYPVSMYVTGTVHVVRPIVHFD